MMNMKSSTAAKKKKTTMMPRGFMCHSQAATAVCLSSADAARSAITSGARNTTMINNNYNARYSKIVESRRFVNPADHGNKPVLLSSMIKREPTLNYHHHYSKPKMSLQKTPSVLPSADNVFQVVVMRVALHCQGCAGKVKKHLSKMEGCLNSTSHKLSSKMIKSRGHLVYHHKNMLAPHPEYAVVDYLWYWRKVPGAYVDSLGFDVIDKWGRPTPDPGVTSFSIDLETKMVTVRGHVSPVGVVESISKVKKAELLPSS